jgi:hypothetical protein
MKNDHFKLLGLRAEDKVTGFVGVVSTLSFDLYGCIQVILTPPVSADGNAPDGRWMDVTRLKILSKVPVMDLPDFDSGYVATGRKGAAMKSLPN